MRDDELYVVEIDEIEFNGNRYREIQIPINHINFDSNNNKRSAFGVAMVAELVAIHLDGLYLNSEGERDGCQFFVYKFLIGDKEHKLVFDIGEKKIFIRVITLYRLR